MRPTSILPWRRGHPAELGAPLVNVVTRLSIAFFLVEVLVRRRDPRYEGKALPARDLPVIGTLSLLFPIAHALRSGRRPYRFGLDNLYLSIFWLDMTGNFLGLYDRYRHFDLIPHFHGTGAAAVVLERAAGESALKALLLSNALHLLVEGEEVAADRLFGLRNVRGSWDVRNDLLAGLLGSIVYALANRRLADSR